MPGVFSGTDGTGVKHLVSQAVKNGFGCYVLNFVSQLPEHASHRNIVPGVTHTSMDLHDVVVQAKQEMGPNSTLIGVGVSLGSNILLHYAGQVGKYNMECPFDALVSLGNPFDLAATTRKVKETWMGSLFYDGSLLESRKRIMIKSLNWLSLLDEKYKDKEMLEKAKNEIIKVSCIAGVTG